MFEPSEPEQRHRTVYNQPRRKLDPKFYEDGYHKGYTDGIDGGIYFYLSDDFDVYYKGSYGPESFLNLREKCLGKLSDIQKLSFQIGYEDAFDRGFQDGQATIEKAWDEANPWQRNDEA
jgi:hypothetical protein